MPSEREPTGSVRSVPGDDSWPDTPPVSSGTGFTPATGYDARPDDDAAIEAFFAGDPATTARTMIEAGAVATETRGGRPRYEARKVRRLVRHIEPWSVLKISLIFFFCLWIILLVAGSLLWRVADSSGMIDNIEKFITEIFALDSFEFDARRIFRIYAVGGLVTVVAATGFTVLMSVLFNLISDLTGGVRITVIEEETARRVRRK